MTRIYVSISSIVEGVSITLSPDECLTMEVGDAHLPVTPLFELEDKLFRTNSAVVLPEREDPGSSTEAGSRQVSAVGAVTSVLRFISEHLDYKILVAGHTDTAGNLDYNEALSQMRAQTVLALLKGDRRRFAEICVDRRFMTNRDYNQILAWVADTFEWDCHPGEINDAGNVDVVNDFRKEYNRKGPGSTWAETITEWGEASNRETWEAYFNCYEDHMADALGTDRDGLAALRENLVFMYDAEWVGCNEYHPRAAKNLDDYPCDSNRRVEIMFFDPADSAPAIGCVPELSGCQKALCPLYNEEELERVILPPMISAKEWHGAWEEPDSPAGSEIEKNMILRAPGLPDGMPVTFGVFAVVDDGPPLLIETTTASGVGGRVETPFRNWYNEVYVQDRGTLGSLADAPKVRFLFEVTCTSRLVASKRIDFSDSVSLRFFEDEAQTAPLANHAYALLTPWFDFNGALDGDGAVAHDGLPPGGVHVMLVEHAAAEDPLAPASDDVVIGMGYQPKDDVQAESQYHPWLAPVIATIYFETGSSQVDNFDDAEVLNSIYDAYSPLFTATESEAPPLLWPFTFVGYADNRGFSEGGEGGNQALSEARARAVFDYLDEPERFGDNHPNYRPEIVGMGVDWQNTQTGDAESLKFFRRVDILAPPAAITPPLEPETPSEGTPLGTSFTFRITLSGTFGVAILNYEYFEFVVTDNTNNRSDDFTYSGVAPGLSIPIGWSFESDPVTIDTAPMRLEDWHGFAEHHGAGFVIDQGVGIDEFIFSGPFHNDSAEGPIVLRFVTRPNVQGSNSLNIGVVQGVGGFYKERSYYPTE